MHTELREKLLSNLRGDLSGALSAAIITLPMSIGYGIIAFAPLGAAFAPQAALLGVYSAVFCGILQHPDLISPFTALVGLVTVAVIFISKRYLKRVPASLTALAVGSALYYGLAYFGGLQAPGSVIGRIEVGLPTPDAIFKWFPAFEQLPLDVLLPELLVTGITIGFLASMESLMASVVSDKLTGLRHNSKKELIGQGLGNMACGLFGALPAAGSIPRSMANYKAGGRTCVSGLLCAVIIFLMVILLAPIIGKLPLPVVSGIIFVVGVMLFDRWSLNLLKRLLISFKFNREVFVDLIIMLVVASVTVSINLIAAVAVGILIASAMFIARMGRSVIKRKYFGSQLNSRKMRSLQHAESLDKEGNQIMVIELQGPLFFGSAEILAVEIEEMMSTTQYCILNFKRVNHIDSTGANIINQIKRKMENGNKYLLLSHLRENQPLRNFLEVMYDSELFDNRYIFPDTDAALEWAEDHLLEKVDPDGQPDRKTELSRIDLFRDFSTEELKIIESRLTFQTYNKGQLVFNEGDDGRDLYLLMKGSMSVKINLPERNRLKRIFTYTSGIVFGELSFLDGTSRSAGVWAHEDSEVLRLPFIQFQALRTERPEIATKLITNLSLVLSRRLRRTSNQVRLLEES